MTKLKPFPVDKFHSSKMTISLSVRVENTVGKGENAGYQHFLLFPLCFPKPSSVWSLKVGIELERIKVVKTQILLWKFSKCKSYEQQVAKFYTCLYLRTVSFINLTSQDL